MKDTDTACGIQHPIILCRQKNAVSPFDKDFANYIIFFFLNFKVINYIFKK